MGQRAIRRRGLSAAARGAAVLSAFVGGLLLLSGCDRDASISTSATTAPSAQPSAKPARIASLVPSATDLLLGSGMGDHLVAVSNYCRANPDAAGFPTAGDYQSTDWERLTQLKPSVMLVFMAPDRLPPGMKDRADALGMRLVNVKVETVQDVLTALTQLGDLAGEPAKAGAARTALQSRLDAVHARAAGRPPLRTLLVVGDDGTSVIGTGGFLDELLTLAGGTNAAASLGTRYPSIDVEKLEALRPDKIIQLLPGANRAKVDAARQFWAKRTLPAARDVTILTDWYLLQPGWRIADIGEKFEAALHGSATTRESK